MIGVPALSSLALSHLDGQQAAALGAVLRLHDERPAGRPEQLPDGRRKLTFEGRVLAETLLHDRGLIVYPTRSQAALAVIEDGDVWLPFQPLSVEPETPIVADSSADGAILIAARSGQIYRFSLLP